MQGALLFYRELLKLGAEVVMVGNTLPAINDVTASELVAAVEDVALFCPTIKASSRKTSYASGHVNMAVSCSAVPPHALQKNKNLPSKNVQACLHFEVYRRHVGHLSHVNMAMSCS